MIRVRLRDKEMRGHGIFIAVALLASSLVCIGATQTDALFRDGLKAYRASDFPRAVLEFREAVFRQPASGSLQNLGLAEWQCGHTGDAILAWEQTLWLDPLNSAARTNLRFARRTAQLETPELSWYEVVSTWLPANWWAWIGSASFWLAVGMATVPGLLRRRKAAWHQAVAALGLMVFLLSLPAHAGIHTRSNLGFVLKKDTSLRLTPTKDAQPITRLASGTPARVVKTRANYLLVQPGSQSQLGWVERGEFGFIAE